MSAVAEPIGHDAIREMLRGLAVTRAAGSEAALHHAWLFAGPTGVGKFQIARWWASLLKCAQLGACQPSCDSCRLVAGAVHPDVFETGPAPKEKHAQQTAGVDIERKKSVGVDESRALLQRLSLRPVRPGPRVAIMREAGTMTAEAQNSLLKLLEEPPGSAVIILVTDNIGAMLPTVRSRCRHLAFGALATHEVGRVLQRLGKDETEAAAAATCSRGSVARGLAFDAEGLAERETLLLAYEEVLRDPVGIDALVQALALRKDDGYAMVDILEWQLAKIETSLGRGPAEPSEQLVRVLDACRDLEPRALIEEAARIQHTIDALARNANPRLAIRDLLMNVRTERPMSSRVHLTTPLYYVNAEPHLGHTYTTVVVDTAARFHRSMGREVFFLTGTDEHGDKIAQAAEAKGTDPRAYADRVSALFRSTWDACGISYDHFVRTTDDYHVHFVQDLLRKIHDAGDIYFGEYGGKYCYGCERFYADRELVGGKCPDHKTEPTFISEKNYFFRMSRYQQPLLDHLAANPELIQPAGYRNEVMGLLREPLEDLCISRPKSRLTWGIELPFDSDYVTYVWFDALVNYVSALAHVKGDAWPSWWENAHHFVAKDILKPHAVFWPTMLMAAGLPVYRTLHVHGYWNMGESKMSKSLGNVIRPLEMRDRFGMDGFRYFLLREMAFGNDAAFTEDAFVTRFNADLSNGIGNLVSRVLAMQEKYFEGAVQPTGAPEAIDTALEEAFATAEKRAVEAYENSQFHVALEEIWKAVAACDKYIVETSPFKMWKDEAARPRVGAILHLLCDGLRHLARLIEPAMPETSAKIASMVGADPGRLADAAPRWRVTYREGHVVGAPEPLFPRVEIPKP